MNKFLKFCKDNWFMCLLVLLFAGISVYYIWDTNKDKLRGKTSGGQDVVYSVNGQDTTISAFYDEMYKSYGTAAVYHLMAKEIANTIDTTDEMKTYASSQASSVISNYSSQYPSNYQTMLGNDLKSLGYSGYDDLENYLIQYQKMLKITGEYAKAHFDELQIRDVSYILIKFTDANNPTTTPTDDETARMKAVDDMLAAGTSFADTASQLSEDTSTASTGGVYGVIDKNTSGLDASFLSSALSLKEGETSGWVYSSSFGYFKIQCTAATPDTLASVTADSSTDPYVSLVSSNDTTLTNVALWAKAQELGVDFGGDDDLKSKLLTYMGIEDTTASSSSSTDAAATAGTDSSASPEATATAAN